MSYHMDYEDELDLECEDGQESSYHDDEDEDDNEQYHDEYDDIDENMMFADPGGNSALRAATKDNPRIYPCPSCGEPDRLTGKDLDLGYQCDRCADQAERGY